MRIKTTTFWKEPRLIITLLKNSLTLDPSVLITKHTLYVLRDKKTTYGFITLKYHTPKVIEGGSFYVYPQWRRKGYGTKLLKYILKKQTKVYVLCKSEDAPLREKQGFGIIRKAPTPLGWRRAFYNTIISPFTGKEIVVMKRP